MNTLKPFTTEKRGSYTLYAYTQAEALDDFRAIAPDRYTPIKAVYAGTKHNVSIYIVEYRLKKSFLKPALA